MWFEMEQKALRGQVSSHAYSFSEGSELHATETDPGRFKQERGVLNLEPLTHGVLLWLCGVCRLGTMSPVVVQSLPGEVADAAQP